VTATSGTAEVNGTRLAYEVAGHGPPVVFPRAAGQFLHDNPHEVLDPPAIERLGDVAVPTLDAGRRSRRRLRKRDPEAAPGR
jgi:hypothetical protein